MFKWKHELVRPPSQPHNFSKYSIHFLGCTYHLQMPENSYLLTQIQDQVFSPRYAIKKRPSCLTFIYELLLYSLIFLCLCMYNFLKGGGVFLSGLSSSSYISINSVWFQNGIFTSSFSTKKHPTPRMFLIMKKIPDASCFPLCTYVHACIYYGG